mmetsp:Transcript_5942/g.6787  ORF Transcript_5942/g.6787 Transcript_5942/m.6787 type:complete len:97 (+) Transcript_5942:1063-1353(+)
MDVVSHLGSMPSVRVYIAYAWGHDWNNEKQWYFFNDSLVTKMTETDVFEAEAFILLYKWFSSLFVSEDYHVHDEHLTGWIAFQKTMQQTIQGRERE